MVYTGFTLDELRASQDADVQALLNRTDILVDAPFEAGMQADLLWRGSSNQKIHLLSQDVAHLRASLDAPGVGVELRIGVDAELFWAGVPTKDFVGQLRQAAERRGITLNGQPGVWA